MNIIKLRGLTKKYSSNVGCFDINLSINKGEIYGLIGANGAGKTTIIRQLVGFIKPDFGTSSILDFDSWTQSKDIMKDLGYLAAEIALPDYMSGIGYLKTIASIRGNVSWDYCLELITYFDLDAKRKIKKMSKGMKQKVAIIAALMHKPKVLILDEPTSGLDSLMQEKFKNLIRNLQKDGTTIFMSSHIFKEIENTCDKVAVIKKGKIVCEVLIKDIKDKNINLEGYFLKFYQEEANFDD